MSHPLITFTDNGFYCAEGDFYIDPWNPVKNAIITHGHSDHARWGSEHYLCHTFTKSILKARLGNEISVQTLDWNVPLHINGVQVSLHPAGHIIGSSQVRIEYRGDVWVISGDYKIEDDGISGSFQPVRCNTFLTESTFGLPIYLWKPQHDIYKDIQNWVIQNQADNRNSILYAYSLGKAQRVIEAVSQITQDIYAHGAVYNMQHTLIEDGHTLFPVKRVVADAKDAKIKNAVIIAPGSAQGSTWLKKFTPYRQATCSGWMQVRGNIRRSNVDRGFVLSDHADWDGLLQAIKSTQAQQVYITHGFQATLARYLNEIGIQAQEVKTAYGTDEETVQPSKPQEL